VQCDTNVGNLGQLDAEREQDLGSVSLPTPLLVSVGAERTKNWTKTCPIVNPLKSSPSSEIRPMFSSVQFLDCSFGNKYK
jgi:hypothetical protein